MTIIITLNNDEVDGSLLLRKGGGGKGAMSIITRVGEQPAGSSPHNSHLFPDCRVV
jgi:hypothetical protein